MSDPTAPSSLPPEQPVPLIPTATPSVPPQPTASEQAAVQSAPAGTGLAPNIAAALACILSLLGGIAFLILEKKNAFVRFYAMQSTILGAAWFIFAILMTVVLMILGSIPLIGWLIAKLAELVYLGFLLVSLYSAFKAFSEKEWEIPYLGKIARQQLAKTPTVS